MASTDKPHIVVLPFAQQGHINPLLQLSRNLCLHGCLITFVLPDNTVPSSKSNHIPHLTFVGVPDLLSPERSRGSNFADSVDSMINMEAGFRALIRRLHGHHEHPVSVIVFDVFMTWCQTIAVEFSIPCVAFFTTTATCSFLCYRIPSLIEEGVLPFPRGEKNELSKEKVTAIPGVPDLLPEEFPMSITFDETHFRFRLMENVGHTLQNAAAIILNTVEELEKEAVETMRSNKKLFAVGPLLLLSGAPVSRPDVNYWPEDEHCLPWLDKQAPGSVIYISLGSVASLTLDQFREFAAGIEESQQSFLWVVRPDSIDLPLEEALPEGFLARTQDRGRIITWGPQLLILSHPALRAFLTHCGWNSIIENLSTGGLPMICWPHVAEQRLNRRLIVEIWRIGVECRHEEEGGLRRGEVARVLREIMVSEKLQRAAKGISDTAKRAVGDGGSSVSSFQSLLKYLRYPT